jgi:hypothetical protein
MGFGALLRAGVPAEFVSEEDVLAGKLKTYSAVILLDQKYARQALVDRLNDYAAAGGVVLADQGTLVKPAAAKVLPFDSAQFTQATNLGLRAARTGGERLDLVFDRTTGLEREWALLAQPMLQKELPAAAQTLASDNRQILARMGRSGDTDYLYVLTADVRDEQSALVTAQTRGRYAYEMFAGDTSALAVVDGTLRLHATVPAGGWRVYAVTPAPLAGVTLSASQTGGQVTVQAAVVGPDQQPISGAFPLQLTVTGPQGQALPYGGYYGTDAGQLSRVFSPAVNDPPGAWKIQVTNLITGQSAQTPITPVIPKP